MTGPALVSIALSAAWGIAALVVLRSPGRAARLPLLACCAALAAAHLAAALRPSLAPVTLGAWALYGFALPDGRLGSVIRRVIVAVVGSASVAWAVAAQTDGSILGHDSFVLAAAGVAVASALGSISRYPKSTAEQKRRLRWLAAGSVLATALAGVCLALYVMIDVPRPLDGWLVATLLFVPACQILSALVVGSRAGAVVLVESIVVAGLAALVVVVYLVVVIGIDGPPHGHERNVLLASIAAAVVVAALTVPVRHRLVAVAGRLVGATEPSTDEIVSGFGARMSRAVPMDELMLQLVESLHASGARGGAEIWTGTAGILSCTVSVPTRPAARIELSEQDRVVVGRARIGGPSWTTVWLPALSAERTGDLRVVPVAHLGELLGLIVVRRDADGDPYSEDDERALVDVARQLGLALHNVRLDSALQASLAELAERNVELQASRLRIVTASDSSRRAIERNLHDGAQQHLVALAVKLGLARAIAEEGDLETVLTLLSDLRGDVQTTIGELRELAHGIYPPLLRDRGLGEALRTAATRSPLPCSVDVDLPGRFPEDVETAAYFCALEAMQNAGKYAGTEATITIRVRNTDGSLSCELSDDGAGFDSATTSFGHGFLNMQDRLGAIGGTLSVDSRPGAGTVVRTTIPGRPLASGTEAAGPAAVNAHR